VINKIDVSAKNGELACDLEARKLDFVEVSALKKVGIDALRSKICEVAPEDFERKAILADILSPSDTVIMVAPLDIEAPKGRLKLPQVQTIRDVLDSSCSTIVVKETELMGVLRNLKVMPKLVIAESQVFKNVEEMLPEDMPLTSFSILYARYKGELETLVRGALAIDTLVCGDRLLIAEACTHHPIGEDVGRVVIPNLLREKLHTGDMPFVIDYCAGYDFPENIGEYKLIIHCGGCMLNRREMLHRINSAKKKGLPITNYGVLIAYMTGILERVVAPLGINLNELRLKKVQSYA